MRRCGAGAGRRGQPDDLAQSSRPPLRRRDPPRVRRELAARAVARPSVRLRPASRRRDVQGSQQSARLAQRCRAPTSSGSHAVGADLVQLVERDERVAVQRRRRRQRASSSAVSTRAMVQPDRRSRRSRAARSTSLTAAHSSASTTGERGADRVDVALVELAEAAPRGPVGAPHRLDLVALEELRQLAAVLGDDARERHRQVVAQREVGLARSASCSPRFRILKISLVAFLAVLADQRLDVLDGRASRAARSRSARTRRR